MDFAGHFQAFFTNLFAGSGSIFALMFAFGAAIVTLIYRYKSSHIVVPE